MRFGWNATSHQILNPGISLWFSEARDAVVGYVDAAGFRVVAGAPICEGPRLHDVIEEWETDCARHSRKTCYFGAGGRVRSALESSGQHTTVVLGAQPVWRPERWAQVMDSRASLRAQLHRATNKGVCVSEWTPARAERDLQLQQVLDEWLQTRGLPPLHFLVEPRTLSSLRDRRVFVAEQHSRAVAFVVLSPIARRNGWLTEQFPRGWGAPNGAVEKALDLAVRTVASEGAHYLTMGLVPLSFRHSALERANPVWLRFLLRGVRAGGRRFYNFGGLEAFKSKFCPNSWESIYAISNECVFTVHCLYAIAEAFTQGPPAQAVWRGLVNILRRSAHKPGKLQPGRC